MQKPRSSPPSFGSAYHGWTGRQKEGFRTLFFRIVADAIASGGIDEAPMAYKDICTVMQSLQDLVDILGTFTPRVVRMDK
jgi:RNA-splicing ligase RtcB